MLKKWGKKRNTVENIKDLVTEKEKVVKVLELH